LELGWFVGQGRKTAVLLDDPCTPELMYRMVDFIAPTFPGRVNRGASVHRDHRLALLA
jgi:hypothetical protein